jgi:cell division protein FtsL
MRLVRLLNVVVIAALVLAAAYVYKIKYGSTVQAQQAAKLRSDIQKERDAIAALRAEWSRLESPSRIQGIVERHLTLRPIEATQFDSIDHLPPRPPEVVPPDSDDPIGAMIDNLHDDLPTGTVRGKTR